MQLVRSIILAVAVLGLGDPASGQSIGIYSTTDGTDCDLIMAPGPVTFYVLARLGGAVPGPIAGADFMIDNLPAGWFVRWSCGPTFSCGDINPDTNPFDGLSQWFYPCEPGQNGLVLLGTLSGFAPTVPSNHTIRILAHPTALPVLPCPTLRLCDEPPFTRVCVSGGALIINGPACTVGVQQASWSQVKALFD